MSTLSSMLEDCSKMETCLVYEVSLQASQGSTVRSCLKWDRFDIKYWWHRKSVLRKIRETLGLHLSRQAVLSTLAFSSRRAWWNWHRKFSSLSWQETWLPSVSSDAYKKQAIMLGGLPPTCPPDSQISHGEGITLNLYSISQKMKEQSRKGEKT